MKEAIAIREYLRKKESKVHMLGICGVGMAGLAFLLKKFGLNVSGCDKAPKHLADWLKRQGIAVYSGHDSSHVINADWLVKSTAVSNNTPELQAARKAKKKIFQRGLVLAQLICDTDSICVCGTHGKTTTTALIAQLLKKNGKKPSFCIGGEVPALGGVAGQGPGKTIVVEADESDGTLAYYHPWLTVITNIEFDHAEYFSNFSALKKCFVEAVKNTRGKTVYCFDDQESRKMFSRLPNSVSYGFSSGADLRLFDFHDHVSGLTFALKTKDRVLGKIHLPVWGRHNALNAAAACAVGLEFRLPLKHIARALKSFQPVLRRFERIIETKDWSVISDYAHHPSEIAALIRSAHKLKRRRLLAVFQPHRYSRTRALGKFFPPAFAGVDELILCPVYEASEKPLAGGLSADLYARFRKYGKINTYYATSLKQAWDYLKTRIEPDDAILLVGAGDIFKIGEWAKQELTGSRATEKKNWHFRVSLQSLAVKLKNSVVRYHEPLAPKTTLRVGGAADIFIEVGAENDLALIVKWAHKNNVPVKIIGAGSNLLISDLGVRGIVLRLKGAAWQNIKQTDSTRIAAGAGVSLQKLANWAAQRGLAGAEFLTGIPGTIGGAVRMNAGAMGQEIGNIIERVKVIEPDGKFAVLNRKQPWPRAARGWPAQGRLAFSYRLCPGLKNRIVIEAVIRLKKGNVSGINKKMTRNLQKRKWMKGLRSAGSIFKNPAGDPAGRLIESLSLKGQTVGGAAVSGQHANVIVTGKNANASDVLSLIESIRFLVRIKRGINLTKEVEYWE